MGKKPNAIKQLQYRGLRALSKEVGQFAERSAEMYEVMGTLILNADDLRDSMEETA